MTIATAVDLWGPSAWKFLHAIAHTYPAAPDDQQIAQFTKFFDALPDVIPCPSCGLHARQYFDSHQAELTQALRSGPRLQRFVHAFHNAVNASRDPPVPPMDFEVVRQIYTHGHVLGRPRPSTQAEWADPYHNMPPWNQQADVKVPKALPHGTEGAEPRAEPLLGGLKDEQRYTVIGVVALALGAFYYYYYHRRHGRPGRAAPAADAAAPPAAAGAR